MDIELVGILLIALFVAGMLAIALPPVVRDALADERERRRAHEAHMATLRRERPPKP
jgi:hypothetical protein